MMSPEERHVMKNIARSLETIAKVLETMNANLVMLGRDAVSIEGADESCK